MVIEFGLGLLVGIVLALTGAGGGILTVPLLVFVMGLGLPQAAPIGLLAVGLAAWVGAVIGLREGIVRYKAAVLMAFCGMLLAPAGVWAAGRLEHSMLAMLFALVLFYVAFRSVPSGSQAVMLFMREQFLVSSILRRGGFVGRLAAQQLSQRRVRWLVSSPGFSA